jgi:SAM-dependent methyltransferase
VTPRRTAWLRRVFEATEDLNRAVILGLVDPRPGGTLLDLGCGDGTFSRKVRERVGAGRVVGIDIDIRTMRLARDEGIDIARADVDSALPIRSHSVDVVHANQVIEHLVNTDDFLREIGRVLKPTGYALLSTNNLASAHNIAALILGWQPAPAHVSDQRVGVGNRLDPFRGEHAAAPHMHRRLFTAAGLRELCSLHGLLVDRSRGGGFYPVLGRAATVAARVLPRWSAFVVQRVVPAQTSEHHRCTSS